MYHEVPGESHRASSRDPGGEKSLYLVTYICHHRIPQDAVEGEWCWHHQTHFSGENLGSERLSDLPKVRVIIGICACDKLEGV